MPVNETSRNLIESAWEDRARLSPGNAPAELRGAISDCLDAMERGELRVAEPAAADGGSRWHVNEWLKKAVLLYFRISRNEVVPGGCTHYFDKVPLRWSSAGGGDIAGAGARIVPLWNLWNTSGPK